MSSDRLWQRIDATIKLTGRQGSVVLTVENQPGPHAADELGDVLGAAAQRLYDAVRGVPTPTKPLPAPPPKPSWTPPPARKRKGL